ncbi:MAG: hypothetical protein KKD47_07230 [Proteobacteria bacterium]|nr:hypothetical protein [Pseudomonadota bacterium]
MIIKGIWLRIFLIMITSFFLSSAGFAVDKNVSTKVALTAKGKKLPEPVIVAVAESLEPKPATAQNITNSIGMTFVYVKPGTFMMGSPPNAPVREDDETYHQVTISSHFICRLRK